MHYIECTMCGFSLYPFESCIIFTSSIIYNKVFSLSPLLDTEPKHGLNVMLKLNPLYLYHKDMICYSFMQMWRWWTSFNSVGIGCCKICSHEIWNTRSCNWPIQWTRSSAACKHVADSCITENIVEFLSMHSVFIIVWHA